MLRRLSAGGADDIQCRIHYSKGFVLVNLSVTNKDNTYLFGKEGIEYYESLMTALGSLMPKLSTKQAEALCNKLQLRGNKFEECQYLQAAVETVITSHIASRFSSSFAYEPKINPPKDVDCAFSINETRYNLEIKCPDFSVKNAIDARKNFKVGAFGRMQNYKEVVGILERLLDPEANPAVDLGQELIQQQHMDNKLKDFLISAHGKFKPQSGENELNILAVGCADPMDMQKWFFYMYGVQGLFTPDSFWPREEYNNVDVALLTNTYHRHHQYWKKDRIQRHWDFSGSFNLIFSNPSRRHEKESLIWNLVDAIPNYSRELMEYRGAGGLDELRIPHFVAEKLTQNGLYYF